MIIHSSGSLLRNRYTGQETSTEVQKFLPFGQIYIILLIPFSPDGRVCGNANLEMEVFEFDKRKWEAEEKYTELEMKVGS